MLVMNLNLWLLHMLEDTFSLGAAHIISRIPLLIKPFPIISISSLTCFVSFRYFIAFTNGASLIIMFSTLPIGGAINRSSPLNTAD